MGTCPAPFCVQSSFFFLIALVYPLLASISLLPPFHISFSFLTLPPFFHFPSFLSPSFPPSLLPYFLSPSPPSPPLPLPLSLIFPSPPPSPSLTVLCKHQRTELTGTHSPHVGHSPGAPGGCAAAAGGGGRRGAAVRPGHTPIPVGHIATLSTAHTHTLSTHTCLSHPYVP